ncbi:MAG TPA: hypothetical protein VL346_07475 [Acidobacteriaceae bacterium]|nr:hypothetical protein [Acidobacteriaceae bacterium]
MAALFILSLLESATVLTRDLLPNLPAAVLPPLQHAAMTFACFGLIAAITAVIRQRRMPSLSARMLAVITGLTLFAIPAALSAIAARSIPPLTIAALESLAPLFCILFDPYLPSSLPHQESRYGILPPLIAFSGVLLIFPVFVPSSYTVALGFALALFAALSLGIGNCLIVRVAASSSAPAASAAITSLSAACLLGLLSAFLEEPRLHADLLTTPTILLFLTELLALALLFWLARRISPTRLVTRVFWTLLLPILIEALALSIPLTFRSWAGLALMASGSIALLLSSRQTAASSGLSLH